MSDPRPADVVERTRLLRCSRHRCGWPTCSPLSCSALSEALLLGRPGLTYTSASSPLGHGHASPPGAERRAQGFGRGAAPPARAVASFRESRAQNVSRACALLRRPGCPVGAGGPRRKGLGATRASPQQGPRRDRLGGPAGARSGPCASRHCGGWCGKSTPVASRAESGRTAPRNAAPSACSFLPLKSPS